MSEPILAIDGLETCYGLSQVLFGVSLHVAPGEMVTLMGRNGMGKTTTLKVISGTLPVWQGNVRYDGKRIDGRSPYEIARSGVTLVPEGRGIFPGLDVRENLDIGVRAADSGAGEGRKERLEQVLETFPRLRERLSQRAGTLSGGEQQMLALSRAVVGEARVVLVDEASMGLSPIMVDQVFEFMTRITAAGTSLLVVEQYVHRALEIAGHVYLLNRGQVAFSGSPADLGAMTCSAAT